MAWHSAGRNEVTIHLPRDNKGFINEISWINYKTKDYVRSKLNRDKTLLTEP